MKEMKSITQLLPTNRHLRFQPIPLVPFIPVNLVLSQTEAFAALGRLRYHTSPTEEILHGGNCLTLILSIAGYGGD